MAFKLGDFFPKKQVNEPGLDLDNPLWKELEGGYREAYDASVALKKLEKVNTLVQSEDIYQELWNELHHQGDVGPASYYAVPHLVRIATEKQLVDFNILGLVTTIEIQRHKNNPKISNVLLPHYKDALTKLADLAKLTMAQDWDVALASTALAAIAVSKGQHKLADAMQYLESEDDIDDFLDNR